MSGLYTLTRDPDIRKNRDERIAIAVTPPSFDEAP